MIRALDRIPAARVEVFLFRVRWILLLLIIPVAWIDSRVLLPTSIIVWLVLTSLGNLLIGGMLYVVGNPGRRLAIFTCLFDMIAFGTLPHITNSTANLLAFFLVFPALVASVRFGPHIGLIVAGLLALPIEVRELLPVFHLSNAAFPPAGLPIAALLAATALVGYLSEHEKDAAIKQAAMELEELRREVDGAKLLYRTTDVLSTTTSYAPILEAMLEAGVKGLPSSRKEDGPAVGIALLFDEEDPKRGLRVVASRQMSPRDLGQLVPGKEGIIGRALQSGNAVVFDAVATDAELQCFTSLTHCHTGVCYPLQAGLEQYGVVVLACPAPRGPSEQHLQLMRAFTNQAALAFQNAKLYENLRLEHDQIIRSENEMRQKLARDLHDGPTQKVAALVMQLDYIRRLLDKDKEAAKGEVEKARKVAQQTVKEIRTSLFALRPLSLESKGLSAALEQYCERLREAEHVTIHMDAGQFGNELDPNVSATVFSIVDEAVNNARKHAVGSPIYVRVYRRDASLVATVQDRGPGFDVERTLSSYDERASLGLQNMRERARLIDADLRIESERGRGTRVTLVVPNPPRSEVPLK